MARATRKQVEDAQATIADQLRDLPENFLMCRDPAFGHDWKPTRGFHAIPVAQIGRKMANLARIETCARCKGIKTEKFVVNQYDLIEKVTQSIDYEEGYLMKNTGVPRGVKRSSLVWTENYRRTMEQVAEAAEGGKKKSSKSNVTPLRKKKSA